MYLNIWVQACVPVEWWGRVAVFQAPVVDGDNLIGGFDHLSVDRALNRVLEVGK